MKADSRDNNKSFQTIGLGRGSVAPDSELWTVFQDMEQSGATQLPVMANGEILGMLTRDDITRFLRTMKELEA